MSRTGKKENREPFDFYSTPDWCVDRLLEKFHIPCWGTVLEPTAGNGAIVKAVYEFSKKNFLTDIDLKKTYVAEIQENFESELKTITPNVFIGDFLKYDFAKEANMPQGSKAKVCIGNPPYSKALSIIQHSLAQAESVCMLLRINFLASSARADWMRENTPDVFVLPNRPRFVNGKSDACEYAWFVWNSKASGKITILNKTSGNLRKGC